MAGLFIRKTAAAADDTWAFIVTMMRSLVTACFGGLEMALVQDDADVNPWPGMVARPYGSRGAWTYRQTIAGGPGYWKWTNDDPNHPVVAAVVDREDQPQPPVVTSDREDQPQSPVVTSDGHGTRACTRRRVDRATCWVSAAHVHCPGCYGPMLVDAS